MNDEFDQAIRNRANELLAGHPDMPPRVHAIQAKSQLDAIISSLYSGPAPRSEDVRKRLIVAGGHLLAAYSALQSPFNPKKGEADG